jgi:hypothetical protein
MATGQRANADVQMSLPSWDGRSRCRLCGDDSAADHDWCLAAGALVCDSCCEEILRGATAKLLPGPESSHGPLAQLEIAAKCIACPRLNRMLVDDEETDGREEDPTRVH